MYDLVEKILIAVTFIAIGGALALIFFFVFAQQILGSSTIHRQLQNLYAQLERLNNRLDNIAGAIERKENAEEDQSAEDSQPPEQN